MMFAACKDMGSELFMSENNKDIRTAKAICVGCPAVNACLEYAIENREQGVWGGTTERERKRKLKYKNYQITVRLSKNTEAEKED